MRGEGCVSSPAKLAGSLFRDFVKGPDAKTEMQLWGPAHKDLPSDPMLATAAVALLSFNGPALAPARPAVRAESATMAYGYTGDVRSSGKQTLDQPFFFLGRR